MAAQPQTSQAAAQAALDALLGKLNVGGVAGTVDIFTGTPPADLETAETGTKLSTLTLSVTAFPASIAITSPRGAQATANAITSGTGLANGNAGYFRAKDKNGVAVIQGTCDTANADMILNTVVVVTGVSVQCTSWVVQLPDGG